MVALQFVYMCREGENEELRYSIRSVLNFFPDAEIWVVGGKPGWYFGNHIPVRQKSGKYNNVKNNIESLLNDERINDSFIYMNDDFYLTDMPDFSQNYHRGAIQSFLDESKECCEKYIYRRLIARAHYKLKKFMSSEPLNYELHIPILISKKQLSYSYKKADTWRSFYGNYYNLGGKEILDCKFYPNNISNGTNLNSFIEDHSPFLSSNDNTFEFLQNNYLSARFPNKTIHEAD
jgi:hypothetical protein